MTLAIVVIIATFTVAFPLALVGAHATADDADRTARDRAERAHRRRYPESVPVFYATGIPLDPASYLKAPYVPEVAPAPTPTVSMVKRVSLTKR